MAHTYGEWIVTKPATATEAGSREKACSVCDDKVVEVIPATGTGGGEGVDPDPTDPGDQPGDKPSDKPSDEPGDKPSDKPADDKKPAAGKDNTLAATGDALPLTAATLSFVALLAGGAAVLARRMR